MPLARRIGTLGLLLFLLGALVASPASAHTTLVSSDPANDATVASITKVTLTYADPVILPRVVVNDAKGGDHVAGPAHATANRVVADLTGPLRPGTYTVGWRVVAPDGHPATGEYRFTVQAAATTPVTAQTPTTPVTHVSPTPLSTSSGSSFSWGWLFLVVLVIAVIGGAVALLLRRRGSSANL